MNTVLFYIIIFLTNVIQGITGFAGTDPRNASKPNSGGI